MDSKSTLGIIAGSGDLPACVVTKCREQGRKFFILAFEDQTDLSTVKGNPHVWVRLGACDKSIKELHKAGVKEVVMAGAIKRPSVAQLKPDWRGAKVFAKIGFKGLGDDGLLRAVIAEIETEGFRVIGLEDILPNILAPVGVWGTRKPDAQAKADIERGTEVVCGLGKLDIGQGCVVQQGIVLAVEAIEGTDAMLERCYDLRRKGAGGVLVKIKKPYQERRVDLPTIGVATVEAASRAGLRGIAIEAGAVIALDSQTIIHKADSLGLFLIGITVAEKK